MSTPIKLTPAQVRTLRDVREGDPVKSCRGRSEYGGRGQVIRSLRRRGFIVSGRDGGVTLTTLGSEWLTNHDADALEKALTKGDPVNDGGSYRQ